MYEIICMNLETKAKFSKYFYSTKAKNDFIRKCKYSKKVMILSKIYWK